jgi:hypothetical protein
MNTTKDRDSFTSEKKVFPCKRRIAENEVFRAFLALSTCS